MVQAVGAGKGGPKRGPASDRPFDHLPAIAPIAWPTTLMSHGQDRGVVAVEFVVHDEWEAAQHIAPDVVVLGRPDVGGMREAIYGVEHFRSERF